MWRYRIQRLECALSRELRSPPLFSRARAGRLPAQGQNRLSPYRRDVMRPVLSAAMVRLVRRLADGMPWTTSGIIAAAGIGTVVASFSRCSRLGSESARDRTKNSGPVISSNLARYHQRLWLHFSWYRKADHRMIHCGQSSQQDDPTKDWRSAAGRASLCLLGKVIALLGSHPAGH